MKKEDIEFLKGLAERIAKDDPCCFPAAYLIEELRFYDNSDPWEADEVILIDGYDGIEYADDDLPIIEEQLAEDAEERGFEKELSECRTVKDVIALMDRLGMESSKEDRVWVRYLHSYWAINGDHGPFLTYEEASEYLASHRRAFRRHAEPIGVSVPWHTDLARLLKIVKDTDWGEGE